MLMLSPTPEAQRAQIISTPPVKMPSRRTCTVYLSSVLQEDASMLMPQALPVNPAALASLHL